MHCIDSLHFLCLSILFYRLPLLVCIHHISPLYLLNFMLCCPAQSLMAFYIWGNEATMQGIAGILLVIFGSGLYTWVQMSLPAAVKK